MEDLICSYYLGYLASFAVFKEFDVNEIRGKAERCLSHLEIELPNATSYYFLEKEDDNFTDRLNHFRKEVYDLLRSKNSALATYFIAPGDVISIARDYQTKPLLSQLKEEIQSIVDELTLLPSQLRIVPAKNFIEYWSRVNRFFLNALEDTQLADYNKSVH